MAYYTPVLSAYFNENFHWSEDIFLSIEWPSSDKDYKQGGNKKLLKYIKAKPKITLALVEHRSILLVVIEPVGVSPHSYSGLRGVADKCESGILFVPSMPHKQL